MDLTTARQLLFDSVRAAPLIWKGEYPYVIHPLTDGVPRLPADLLEAAVTLLAHALGDARPDAILTIEAMGLPVAAPLATRLGLPLLVVRKRAYGLPGELTIDQSTGYAKGRLHLNGVRAGERLLLVDDVISTGGTLIPVVEAVCAAGASVEQVLVVFEKGEGRARAEAVLGLPVHTLARLEVDDGVVSAHLSE